MNVEWTDANVHNHPALNVYGVKVKDSVRKVRCRFKLDARRDAGFRAALAKANQLHRAGTPTSYRSFTSMSWEFFILSRCPKTIREDHDPTIEDSLTDENVKRALNFFTWGRYGAKNKPLYTTAEMEKGTDNRFGGLDFWLFPEPLTFLLLAGPVINGANAYLTACKKQLNADRNAGDDTIPSDAELDKQMTIANQFGFTGDSTIIIEKPPKKTVLEIATESGFNFGF